MSRIDRITKNEERLDEISLSVKNLEKALIDFKLSIKKLDSLKKYYGSSNWFKDKEAYENNTIPKIKAGVLSEDAVWDILDDIDNLIKEMKEISNR